MGRDDEQEDGAAADDETSPADLAASDITNNDAITRRAAHSARSTQHTHLHGPHLHDILRFII